VSSTIFFQNVGGNDIATLTKTFQVNGVNTDPTAVSCLVTDPTQTSVLHTYNGSAPADITKVGTGVYQLLIGNTIAGLWGFEWIGTGTASDVDVGTWTANPATVAQYYTSVEELKDRLQITSTVSDMSCQFAVQGAASVINRHCARHFYQITEARTFPVYSMWEQPLDDIATTSGIQLAVDFDGDGTFEQNWTLGTDYQLVLDGYEFNVNSDGEPRPYTRARVINFAGGGRFFPFVWPFSRLDRVQVTATWGWPAVPFSVKQAALQVAAELFKLKDSPFGIVGAADWGLMRITRQNPVVADMLAPYRSSHRKVGV
jgi:hypothetical protein